MRHSLWIWIIIWTFFVSLSARAEYDPLLAPSAQPVTQDFSIQDVQRHREIPVRVYLPSTRHPAPVILFSHGLGGSREGYAYLGQHWAAQGYICVFMQHLGSDDAVWRSVPIEKRLSAMNAAANVENFILRVKDVPAVLDQLAIWNLQKDHPLFGRFDLDRIGMAGHSFGAVTTQAVTGQRFIDQPVFTDPRIKAAVIMSPSSSRGHGDRKDSFAGVKIPWMLMTGTHDVSIIGHIDLASRLAVFPALPPGDKYQLILDKAAHSVFSGRVTFLDSLISNPHHRQSILALSTAFFDTYLRNDPHARTWLTGPAVRQLIDPADQWETK